MSPKSNPHGGGGNRLIDSLNTLFAYVLVTALMVALAAAIVINIISLNNAINSSSHEKDAPLNLPNITTTTQATAELTTTKGGDVAEVFSEDMKELMDLSVSPCDDFYTYACGGWQKSKVNHPETYLATPREVNIDDSLIEMLEKPISEADPIYKSQVKKFFTGCADDEKLDARGNQPFKDFLKSLGKFGLLDPDYNPKELTLKAIIGKLTKMGIEPLFKVRTTKVANSLAFLLSPADVSGMGSIETQWMRHQLELLGADKNLPLFEEQISEALKFQEKLYGLSQENKESNKSIDELKTVLPDWFSPLEFFTELASTNPGKMPGNITDHTEVLIENLHYFTELGNLYRYHQDDQTAYLGDYYYRATDNYVLRLLLPLAAVLGSRYENTRAFNDDLEKNKRLVTCVDLVTSLLRTQVIKMYIDESYDSKPDAYVKDMITDLKTALRQRTTDSTKIKEEDKKLVYEKLDNMQAKVGYVEGIHDEKVLNNIYKWGPSEELFEAYFASLRFEFNKTLWSDNINWLSDHNSFTSSAGHLPHENYLVVPAKYLLQTPLLNVSLASSMNYGSMGFFLSYLITKPWLETMQITPSLHVNSADKDECLVKEYSTFMFGKFKVDGRTSHYENVVDNEAIKTSYKAYESFTKRKGDEPQTPDTSLSHSKRFFISFAQSMCHSVPPQDHEEVLRRSQAPNKIRVLGSLRNFNSFAEAFKCKTDAPMNPESKCQTF